MRFLTRLICALILAFFAFSFITSAAECPKGYILYRQTFDETSHPSAAGIIKGTDGEDGFDFSVMNDTLRIDSYDDRKSYVIFPYELPDADHTIEYTFSFSQVDSSNAYVGFMLTSKGDAPDNITSAIIRANGTCDGFGALSNSLAEKIASGENVKVTIPVENGAFYEITVSCGGERETLSCENIADIPVGRIGFVTRNASVAIYEVAVANGVGYSAKTGELKNDSTWSDERPYVSQSKMMRLAMCGSTDGVPVSPQTSDPMMLAVFAFGASAAAFAITSKKRYK